MGDLGHFIHAHGVHEEGGNTHHIAQLLGQIRAQIGGMLAIRRSLHIVHHLVVDGIGAAGDGTVQTAAAAHRVKVLQLIASLGDGVQDGVLAVVRLVDDPLELIQLLGGVVNAQLIELLVLLEHSDLGAGGAGVDDKDLHMGVPSLSFYFIEYFVKNFTESLNELFTVLHFPSGLSTALAPLFPRLFKYRRCEQKKKAFGREIDQTLFLYHACFSKPRSRISAMAIPRAAISNFPS